MACADPLDGDHGRSAAIKPAALRAVAELIANVAARISAFRRPPQRDDEALLVLRFGG